MPLYQLFLSVLQASISKCVYLTNRIKFISENTEHLFFVLLSVKIKVQVNEQITDLSFYCIFLLWKCALYMFLVLSAPLSFLMFLRSWCVALWNLIVLVNSLVISDSRRWLV